MKTFGAAVLVLGMASLGLVGDLSGPPAGCLFMDSVTIMKVVLTEFLWPCIVVESGTTVTWVNPDGRAHDPGSKADGGACFRAVNDLGHEQQPGESYSVKFTYDGVSATATVNVTKNCDAALDDSSTAREGVIPYICYLHPSLFGLVQAKIIIQA